MVIEILLPCLIFAFLFLPRRAKRYLQIFQQETYYPHRYLAWFSANKAYDRRASIILLPALILELALSASYSSAVSIMVCAAFLVLTAFEPDPLRDAKVPLVLTNRAKRIYWLAIGLCLLLLVLCSVLASFLSAELLIVLIGLFVVVQLCPFTILASDYLLRPLEHKTQERYREEALTKLSTINPAIIGVTGSYGKTSVKLLTAELASVCLGPTFAPGKGVNTEMGIVREIREKLKAYDSIAVIEMAAYGEGSVARLCKIFPPKLGIITAIGEMHLERFGSREAVYRAKTELARALPEGATLIVNQDNDFAARAGDEFESSRRVLRYGLRSTEEAGELFASARVEQLSDSGSFLEIMLEGKAYSVKTKFVGSPGISNILAALSAIVALGGNAELAVATVSSLEPHDNRLKLEVADGITWLHDAYNSNPIGFRAALDVLSKLKSKRRWLITPGMIELGEEQYEANKAIAKHAAGICDQIVFVGDTNQQAFGDGVSGSDSCEIHFVPSRDEAFKLLHDNKKDGDAVLLENDLPDLYEAKWQS